MKDLTWNHQIKQCRWAGMRKKLQIRKTLWKCYLEWNKVSQLSNNQRTQTLKVLRKALTTIE